MATSSVLEEGMDVDYSVPSSVSVQAMSDSEVSSWTKRLIGSFGGCITADPRRNLLQKYLQKQEAGASNQPLPLSSRVDEMTYDEVCTILLNQIGSFAECKDEQSQRILLKTYLLNKELKGQRSRDLPDYDSELRNRDLLRHEATFVDNLGYGELATMMEAFSMEVTKSPIDDAYRLKQVLFCGDRNESSQEMRNMVDETMKKYNDIKEKLAECYSELIDTVQEESFKKEMSKVTDERYPDYEKELLSTKTMLQDMTAEFDIVITGETSAGKSTFLNVLLGESILPKGHLPTTASLCRLHNSENRTIKYDAENGSVNIALKVDSNELKEKLISINEQLRSDDRDDEPLKTIDVYWPISSLHENVVLVDTPGIGERDALTKKVAEYVPNSAGYIFIIDSSRAGGVLDSGIKKLIEAVAESALTEEQKTKGLSNVFFVCNKWDLVPKGEKKAVLERIKQNLIKCCRRLGDWQIVLFNAQLELQLLEWKANTTKNIQVLFKSLETLMTRTIEKRLGDKYRWLRTFVKEVLGFLNARMNTESESKERIQADIQEAKKQLELASSHIRQALREHLKSADTEEKLLDWTDSAPELNEVDEVGPTLIRERLQNLIFQWVTLENGPFEQASERIAVRYKGMQAENDLRCTAKKGLEHRFILEECSDQTATPSSGVIILVVLTSPILIVVAVIVLVLGIIPLAVWGISRHIRSKERGITAMREMTKKAVVKFLEKDIETFITDSFTRHHIEWLNKIVKDAKCKTVSTRETILQLEQASHLTSDTVRRLTSLDMKLNGCSECLQKWKIDI